LMISSYDLFLMLLYFHHRWHFNRLKPSSNFTYDQV
jgi:hypothetical protein